MRTYVNGIGALGPGLCDWPASRLVLAGKHCYRYKDPAAPAASILPPNEHRRSSEAVRWAIQVAHEAIAQAGTDPQSLATVFASSCGEAGVLDQICTALAMPQRSVSPTLFHQSVHNAAAGYWGIATACQRSSTAVACYDSSFASGLLEAAAYLSMDEEPVLLVAYDIPPPPPLLEARPVRAKFAVGFTLTHHPAPNSFAEFCIELTGKCLQPETTMKDKGLEALRLGTPAARSLPLLAAIAKNRSTRVRMDCLDQQLRIDVKPWIS
jgi:hypothetical protein